MDILTISDIFLVVIAFLWLITASFIDIKKREIPNWLSFSLLAIAFALRLMVSISTGQWSYFLYALLAFVIFFLIANILYYTKSFGGGDAKLLMALAVVLATTPSFIQGNEPFLLSFVINILVIGSVYSLIFSIFLAIKNRKSFVFEFKRIHSETKKLRIFFYITSAICLVLSFMSSWFVLLLLVFLIFPYLFFFAKAVEKSSMIRQVSAQDISEGDWLVHQVKINNKTIKPSVHGLSSDEIKFIRKANKKVPIKYGIPFVPVFLLALISSLLLGDLLIWIITRILL